MKINIEDIPRLLSTSLSRSPTIIYFGVGSEFYPRLEDRINTNHQEVTPWSPSKNQQFPLFLQNFKCKNSGVKLLIILIDPLISERPFIVQETFSWYSGSFENVSGFTNLFDSTEFGISVCTIKNYVDFDKINDNVYSVINMLTDCANLVLENNALMFYHDYSGIDPSIASRAVSKNFQHLPSDLYKSKICIDISNGQEGDCSPSLDMPRLYPIILIDHELIYKNPKNMTTEEKRRIFNKFRENNKNEILTDVDDQSDTSNSSNISNTSNTSNISKYKINLFDEIDIDLLLYIQLKSLNELEIKSVNNSVFPILRQLIDSEEQLPDFEWALYNLRQLQIDNENIKENYIRISELIKLLKNGEQFREIRQEIKLECYRIIEYFMINLCVSYGLDSGIIGIFMEELYSCDKPYDLANIYKKFYIINRLV